MAEDIEQVPPCYGLSAPQPQDKEGNGYDPDHLGALATFADEAGFECLWAV